jgi:hypothetical protein
VSSVAWLAFFEEWPKNDLIRVLKNEHDKAIKALKEPLEGGA